MGRCEVTKANGQRCVNQALANQTLCVQHNRPSCEAITQAGEACREPVHGKSLREGRSLCVHHDPELLGLLLRALRRV